MGGHYVCVFASIRPARRFTDLDSCEKITREMYLKALKWTLEMKPLKISTDIVLWQGAGDTFGSG